MTTINKKELLLKLLTCVVDMLTLLEDKQYNQSYYSTDTNRTHPYGCIAHWFRIKYDIDLFDAFKDLDMSLPERVYLLGTPSFIIDTANRRGWPISELDRAGAIERVEFMISRYENPKPLNP